MCNEIESRTIYQTQKNQNISLEFEIKEINQLQEYPDTYAAPHKHDFYFILFMIEGNSIQKVDFEQIPVAKNEILFMYPGQVHSFKYDKKVKGYTLYFTEDFLDNTSSSVYTLHQFFGDKRQIISLDTTKSNAITSVFLKLYKEFLSIDINRKEMLKAYTEIVLTMLLREITSVNTTVLQSQTDFFELLKFQEKYYNKNMDIKEVCKEIGYTQKKINHVSKKYFGKTFLQLLNEKKVLEIKRLLCTSELSIKEIAYTIGFSDDAHFNHFFKKKVGITPLGFRKNYFKG